MKHLNDLALAQNQLHALAELRRRLAHEFEVEEIILYGSVARGQADEESDLDLLIITSKTFTRSERHEITDVVFEVNLRYDTNLSTLVVDRKAWESGLISVLPLHDHVLNEGVKL